MVRQASTPAGEGKWVRGGCEGAQPPLSAPISGRREVVIPADAVARVETDAIVLTLSKDEIGALPSARVYCTGAETDRSRAASCARSDSNADAYRQSPRSVSTALLAPAEARSRAKASAAWATASSRTAGRSVANRPSHRTAARSKASGWRSRMTTQIESASSSDTFGSSATAARMMLRLRVLSARWKRE